MSNRKTFAAAAVLILLLAGCAPAVSAPETAPTAQIPASVTDISLSGDAVHVNGTPAGTDDSAGVYTANDIVYYEAGHNFTYGEGTPADAHSAEEAAAHTVVHISQP